MTSTFFPAIEQTCYRRTFINAFVFESQIFENDFEFRMNTFNKQMCQRRLPIESIFFFHKKTPLDGIYDAYNWK